VIQAYILTAAITAAFGSGWQINQWRHDANEKQAIEAAAVAQRELYGMEQRRSNGVISAQNVARTREIVLRRDADSARSSIDGLREQSAVALLGARTSHDACLVASSTATELLNQCGKRYSELGATADRWVGEVILLQDSWPK